VYVLSVVKQRKGRMEVEERKLAKRLKSTKIDDHDVNDWEGVKSAFSDHWQPHDSHRLLRSTPGHGQVIYSDLTW
jgi:hypothetical protein